MKLLSIAAGVAWAALNIMPAAAADPMRFALCYDLSKAYTFVTPQVAQAARDYAEIRFLTHNDQFNEIKAIWQSFESAGTLTKTQDDRLTEIERRDGVFPDIDPGLWVTGAKQTRSETPASDTNAHQLAETSAKHPAADAAKSRPFSNEAATRTAADSTKFDGVKVEQGITHEAAKKP